MEKNNCPLCLNPVSQHGTEAAKTCPTCGADLTNWRLKHLKTPEMISCPMCQSLFPLEGNEAPKTCTNCGADLTRRKPNGVKPPSPDGSSGARPLTDSPRLVPGFIGSLMGAGVGVGVMYVFYEKVGFRFPLLGVGILVLTGFGARLLHRGTGRTLGLASGAISMLAVAGTLYLMYGTFPIISIISVVVSASLAYRIAS